MWNPVRKEKWVDRIDHSAVFSMLNLSSVIEVTLNTRRGSVIQQENTGA